MWQLSTIETGQTCRVYVRRSTMPLTSNLLHLILLYRRHRSFCSVICYCVFLPGNLHTLTLQTQLKTHMEQSAVSQLTFNRGRQNDTILSGCLPKLQHSLIALSIKAGEGAMGRASVSCLTQTPAPSVLFVASASAESPHRTSL